MRPLQNLAWACQDFLTCARLSWHRSAEMAGCPVQAEKTYADGTGTLDVNTFHIVQHPLHCCSLQKVIKVEQTVSAHHESCWMSDRLLKTVQNMQKTMLQNGFNWIWHNHLSLGSFDDVAVNLVLDLRTGACETHRLSWLSSWASMRLMYVLSLSIPRELEFYFCITWHNILWYPPRSSFICHGAGKLRCLGGDIEAAQIVKAVGILKSHEIYDNRLCSSK